MRRGQADGARRPLPVRVGLMLLASAAVYVPGLIWLKTAVLLLPAVKRFGNPQRAADITYRHTLFVLLNRGNYLLN